LPENLFALTLGVIVRRIKEVDAVVNGRPAGSARRGWPEAIDECPNKNRIFFAFAIEWNSGMYSGDPAVFFVLSVIIDEVIE
jgi:hypothetical protein